MKKLLAVILTLLLSVIYIYAQKSIKVAAFKDLYPYSYVEDGKLKGFYPELTKHIFEKHSIHVEFVIDSWSENYSRILDGKIDLLPQATFTEERTKIFDFTTVPASDSWTQIIALSSSKIRLHRDLNNKTIGVMAGDQNGKNFIKFAENLGLAYNIIEASTYTELEQLLLDNKVFAAVTFGSYRPKDPKIERLNIVFGSNLTLYAVKKGMNGDLLEIINNELTILKNDRNSIYYKLMDKYIFQEDHSVPIYVWFTIGLILFITIFSILWVIMLSFIVRKKTKELSTETEKFKYLFDNMSQGVVYHYLNGNVSSMNKSAENILGVNNKTAKGKEDKDEIWGVTNENGEEFLEDVPSTRALKSGKEEHSIMGIWNQKLNQRRWINVRAKPIFKDYKITGVFAVFDDITELKQSKNELEKIIQHMPSAFAYHEMIYDKNGNAIDYKFLKANPNFYKMTKYPKMEGRTISDQNGLQIGKAWAEHWENNLKLGKITEETYDSEADIWYETSTYKVDDHRFVIMFNDITEKKTFNIELEKQVKEKTDQLIQSEKMASLGNLIAGIAHEMNTPLGSILASIENIDDLNLILNFVVYISDLPKNEYDLFTRIISNISYNTDSYDTNSRKIKNKIRTLLNEKNVKHDEVIIDYLYDIGHNNIDEDVIYVLEHKPDAIAQLYSFISIMKSLRVIRDAAGKISKIIKVLKIYSYQDPEEELSETSIVEEVENILTLLSNKTKRGVEIVREYERVPSIMCYSDKLSQVFMNVIVNAIQAMNYHGTLEISIKDENDNIVVSVSDTGVGIPEKDQDKVFDPFYTTKEKGEGSGLGLSISKTIVESHNGKIYFKSELNPSKTTFYIAIPKGLKK